jgi:hypothetical protein
MARSRADVCNLALEKIGSEGITTFPEDSVIGRLCSRFYLPTVEEELRTHNWNFSLERKALNQDVTTPIGDEYVYQYSLPTDPYCLKVIRQLGIVKTLQDYRIEGRKLLSNFSSMGIQYVREIEDPNLFDSLFTEAVAAKLAYKMCLPITNDKSLRDRMVVEYDKAIANAEEANEIESEPPTGNNIAWESEGR